MDIKVSVIVPVYNVNKYVESSIKSICLQDFSDYEIVVVNDGTKDNSIEIAKSVLNQYSIEYTIINKENGGLPSARNAGINVARGEYVCFIDSDDVISSTHIRDLWECCEKNNLIASYSLFQLTYESNRLGKPINNNSSRVISRDELLHGFLIRKLRIHCCTLLIKRQYLLENNILFNEVLQYGEDIDFMWRLFPTLSELGCTGNETYMYLQRSNSLMSKQNADRVKRLLLEFKKTVEEQRLKYPEDVEIWDLLYGKAALAFYRTFAESADYNLFKQLLHETNYKNIVKTNLKINSMKLKILAASLMVSARLFVFIVKKNRETISND